MREGASTERTVCIYFAPALRASWFLCTLCAFLHSLHAFQSFHSTREAQPRKTLSPPPVSPGTLD